MPGRRGSVQKMVGWRWSGAAEKNADSATVTRHISEELSRIDGGAGMSAQKLFEIIDKDQDGTIDRNEFEAIYEAIKDEVKAEHYKETELEQTAKRAVRRAKVSCVIIVLLLMLVALLLAGTGYIVYYLIEVTKEMHVTRNIAQPVHTSVYYNTYFQSNNGTAANPNEYDSDELKLTPEAFGEPEKPPVAVHTTSVQTSANPALTSPTGDVIETATTHTMGDITELPYMTEDDLQRLKYISYQDALGNSISARMMHWKFTGRTLAGQQEHDTGDFETNGWASTEEEPEYIASEDNSTEFDGLDDETMTDQYQFKQMFGEDLNSTELADALHDLYGEDATPHTLPEDIYVGEDDPDASPSTGENNATANALAMEQVKHSEPALTFYLSNGDIGFVQNGAYMIMGQADGMIYYNAMSQTLNMTGSGKLSPPLVAFHTKTCAANRCPWRDCTSTTSAGQAREVRCRDLSLWKFPEGMSLGVRATDVDPEETLIRQALTFDDFWNRTTNVTDVGAGEEGEEGEEDAFSIDDNATYALDVNDGRRQLRHFRRRRWWRRRRTPPPPPPLGQIDSFFGARFFQLGAWRLGWDDDCLTVAVRDKAHAQAFCVNGTTMMTTSKSINPWMRGLGIQDDAVRQSKVKFGYRSVQLGDKWRIQHFRVKSWDYVLSIGHKDKGVRLAFRTLRTGSWWSRKYTAHMYTRCKSETAMCSTGSQGLVDEPLPDEWDYTDFKQECDPWYTWNSNGNVATARDFNDSPRNTVKMYDGAFQIGYWRIGMTKYTASDKASYKHILVQYSRQSAIARYTSDHSYKCDLFRTAYTYRAETEMKVVTSTSGSKLKYYPYATHSVWRTKYMARLDNTYDDIRWPFWSGVYAANPWAGKPAQTDVVAARAAEQEVEAQYWWKLKLFRAKACLSMAETEKVASNKCWKEYFNEFAGAQGVEAAARAMCAFDESICDGDFEQVDDDNDLTRRRQLRPIFHNRGRQLRNNNRRTAKLTAEEKQECLKAVAAAKDVAKNSASVVKGLSTAMKDTVSEEQVNAAKKEGCKKRGGCNRKVESDPTIIASVIASVPIFGTIDLALGATMVAAELIDSVTGDKLNLADTLQDSTITGAIYDARDWVNENGKYALPISVKGVANLASKAAKLDALDKIGEYTSKDLATDAATHIVKAVEEVFSAGQAATYGADGVGGGGDPPDMEKFPAQSLDSDINKHRHSPHHHSPITYTDPSTGNEVYKDGLLKVNDHAHSPHNHDPHSHTPQTYTDPSTGNAVYKDSLLTVADHNHNPHNHDPHSHSPHSHDPHSHDPHSHTPKTYTDPSTGTATYKDSLLTVADHNHSPHSHDPHSHDPHSHDPHGHDPHNHDPHSHDPHSHSHSHNPHGHAGTCFSASSRVSKPDGSTVPISQIAVGDVVSGWHSPAEALSGMPAKAMHVATVQKGTLSGYMRLHGLRLYLDDGSPVSLPPFVTSNHALLSAAGTWLAINASLSQAELYQDREVKQRDTPLTFEVPKVGAVVPGSSRLLLSAQSALAAAAAETNASSAASPLQAALVMAYTDEDMTSELSAQPVYSFELEEGEDAAYIVNGILAMD